MPTPRQTRQEQSTKCPALQVAAHSPPGAWDSLGYEGKTAESTLGLGRMKCSSIKLPCAMSQPIALYWLWPGVWYEGVPASWGVSGHYKVVVRGRWGVKQKAKCCPQTQKCTRGSSCQLSKVNRIWTSKHSRKVPTTHASVQLFSCAPLCSNQVKSPYFSVSYCGCAITEVGMAMDDGPCPGAQVYRV